MKINNKRKQQERKFLLGSIAAFIFVATAVIFIISALFCKEYFTKLMTVNLPIIVILLISCIIFVAGFMTCKIKYNNKIDELNDKINELEMVSVTNKYIRDARKAEFMAEVNKNPKASRKPSNSKSKNIECIFG